MRMCALALLLGIGLVSCNRDANAGRDEAHARQAGRDAYRTAQRAKRDLKEAGREIQNASKAFREGWNEARNADKNRGKE
jgi:hypothetical protein